MLFLLYNMGVLNVQCELNFVIKKKKIVKSCESGHVRYKDMDTNSIYTIINNNCPLCI
jgi:hypothetical protein